MVTEQDMMRQLFAGRRYVLLPLPLQTQNARARAPDDGVVGMRRRGGLLHRLQLVGNGGHNEAVRLPPTLVRYVSQVRGR